MNLLTGVLQPDGGALWLDGVPFKPHSRTDSAAAGISFIQQELNIFPNLSVAENLFLLDPPRRFGRLPFVSCRQMVARTRELLKQVDLAVSPTSRAGALSAGERQLLEIARGLAGQARLFIFDEPTSSLTAREAARLFDIVRRLLKSDVAVLYISHNLEEVLALADDIMVMRDGRVTLNDSRANLTTSDLVLAIVGRPIEALFSPRETPLPSISPPLLEVSGLTKAGTLENINLRVGRGEIVGIAGLMGSGRSEFARALFGLDSFDSGVVRMDGTVLPSADVGARLASGMTFLTEDRRHEGLLLDASVADNMALAALPLFASPFVQRIERNELLRAVTDTGRRLHLKSGDVQTTPVRTLSGGNQQKTLLGRWLMRQPRLFILDEPTRGVDVGAKEEIYKLLAQLAEAGVALLLISSELEELIGLCDRIHVMRRGELVAEFTSDQFDCESILREAFGQTGTA
jgi:ribose transport system ATP-binding protein